MRRALALFRDADRVVIRKFEGRVCEHIEGAVESVRSKPAEDFVPPELV